MRLTVCIATYGGWEWAAKAERMALPSVQNWPCEVLARHEPEGTIASSRNALAERATGDWLCFLDADDELAPGFFSEMERVVENWTAMNGERFCRSLLLTPSRNHRGVFAPEQDIFKGNWLVIGTLVSTDLFLAVGGFPDYPYGFEDWALWVKCVKAGAQIFKVPNALYRAHRSGTLQKSQFRDPKWQSETHARIAAELGL